MGNMGKISSNAGVLWVLRELWVNWVASINHQATMFVATWK